MTGRKMAGGVLTLIVLFALAALPVSAAGNTDGSAWSGWYVGATAGQADGDWKVDGSADGSTLLASAEDDGLAGSLNFGFQRVTGRLMWGFELGYSRTELKSTVHPAWDYDLDEPDDFAFATYETSWAATATGRVGVLPSPAWLIYADAGIALGEVSHDFVDTDSIDEGEFGSASETANGWVYGLGVQRRLGSRWSVGVEWRVIELDTEPFLYEREGMDNYGLPWLFNVTTEVETVSAVVAFRL